ncbi:MAG: hypothetical protein ED556_04985 [Winogradskyella sp.]|uniref:haloacid dehalogenase-like hydrolase n=1 Tax=Winogradskyella sp. TaxID=1883156 RepID=UPI000F40529F|nr:haloacid dehalogenase-like hydrolase [Winogradskyella sp.]RNC86779.1 MAG: hypothetical protein ED556_04985 [Winogradskyella sp.]
MDKKVLVVDLDGTLYNCNTFHEFLKYVLSYYFKDFRLLKFKILLFFIKLRLFRIISHSRLKYQVLKLIKNDDINVKDFISKLSKYKNVIEEVSDSSFNVKILATAAPNCYANEIAKVEGFDVCFATGYPESGYYEEFENLGEQKKNVVFKYLETNNFSDLDVFITDHIDDAPLMEMATKNILINPDTNVLRWLKKNLINFEVRKTR